MRIPQIAEHNDYLMHALLGLGASHLHRKSPSPSYLASAVAHLGHAIAGLNSAIVKPDLLPHEADAMLAAVYALTFQASYMEDGLVDFMTLVRGCALIMRQILSGGIATSFDLRPDAYVSHLEPGVSQLSAIDEDILTIGLQSLSRVSPILKSQTDLSFFFSLKRTLSACFNSTKEGFIEFAKIFRVWFDTPSSSFNELVDTTNETAQVLLSYFLTVQLLMTPVTMPMYKPPNRAADTSKDAISVIISWARQLFRGVPEAYKQYIGWPEAVVREVEKEVNEEEGSQRGILVTIPGSVTGEPKKISVR